MTRDIVLYMIELERERQEKLHPMDPGEALPTLEKWMAILGEEYGEACKAVLERGPDFDPGLGFIIEEVLHVAAVAVRILEVIEYYEP